MRMRLGTFTLMNDYGSDSNSKQHKSDVIVTHWVRVIEI